MKRSTAFLLVLVGAIFVGASVFLMLRGATAGRTFGLAGVAFFGACAIVGAISLFPRKRIMLDSAGGLTLKPDPVRTAALVLGALGMSAGSLLLAPAVAEVGRLIVSYVCYFGGAFFGLGALAGIWRLLTRTALARIDQNGVRTFGPGKWALAWNEIDEVGIFRVQSTRLIAFNSTTSPGVLGAPRYSLTVAGTTHDFEGLLEIAQELWERNRSK